VANIVDQTGQLPRFAFDDEVGSDDLQEDEDVAPPAPSIAPVALVDEIPEADLAPPVRPFPTRAVGLCALAIALVASVFALRGTTQVEAISVAASLSNPAPPLPIEPPVAAAPTMVEAPPPPAPTTGTLVIPLWAKGRKVFVDGKEIGKSPKLEVACGKHAVKIGIYGKTKKLDIPCGKELKVMP
jgi:hypothetical protein